MNNCYVTPCMEGMYSGDENADDSSLFMCERHALTDLLDGLKAPCSCGMMLSTWTLDSIIQVIYKIAPDKLRFHMYIPNRRGMSFALHSAAIAAIMSRGHGLVLECLLDIIS